jgi:hypothetical protein
MQITFEARPSYLMSISNAEASMNCLQSETMKYSLVSVKNKKAKIKCNIFNTGTISLSVVNK